MDIGKRVRELREEHGLTITDLASRSNLTRNAVSRIELGHRIPGSTTVEKLARGLGVDPGDLYSQEEQTLAGSEISAPPDTPEKALAREAIASRMEEAGEPIQYLTMPQEDLLARFVEMKTPEEAMDLAMAIRAERELFNKTLPGETFPGHPTWAISGTLATAIMGVKHVAKREQERIGKEAEEAAKSLEMPAGVGAA